MKSARTAVFDKYIIFFQIIIILQAYGSLNHASQLILNFLNIVDIRMF